MKRLSIVFILTIMVLMLVSCNKKIPKEYEYSINSIKDININKDEFKIMQLTDLHFSYGFDYLDMKTYKLISYLVEKEEPDLIVITGDMFMSILAKSLLRKLIRFMEQFKIPWTLTFGNHEREYHDINIIVEILMKAQTNYLYFHPGKKLSLNNTHGASNFKIRINKDDVEFLNIYLLDSKDLRKDGIKDKDFPYDYLSVEQVNWYKEEVELDTKNNIVFMHMPLLEFLEYDGDDIREKMWPQGKNTNFFEEMKNSNKALGVFVGHDHNNEFEFYISNIMLAYGRNSGYNAYGNYTKGARIIIYNNLTGLSTYLVGDKNE